MSGGARATDATRRVRVLDLPVDAVDRDGLIERVGAFIDADARATVAYLNVHVANTAHKDARLREFLQGVDLCYCDGSGIRLGARILGASLPERMTGADWIHELAARAEGRWRLAWVGGEPGVAEVAIAKLRERHPKLEARGWHGYYTDAETPAMIAEINAYAPQIVLVGMGTPTQERWVDAHRGDLQAPVVWCLGATADFVAGKVSRGPRWMLDNHLEWLARLIVEPGRLWRRYLLGNPQFLARVILERSRQRCVDGASARS